MSNPQNNPQSVGNPDPAIKTSNLDHQQEWYDKVKDRPYFALFWEMGLGKTKLMIDVASHLFLEGKIEGLLIVAPNSVYTNWPAIEMPLHMAVPYLPIRYKTGAGSTSRMRQKLLLDPTWDPGKLRVVAMSYDSLRTEDGYDYAKKFATIYKTMMVADESTAIKNGSTATAKAAKKIRARCHYAWIATGTPAAQSPFDVHSQIEFLDEDFWKEYGLRSSTAFKNQFGEYKTRYITGGRKFPELVGYRRLDHLHGILDTVSSRLLKEDSSVKLPPKTYTVRTFEMEKSQRALYEKVRDEFVAESRDPGFYLEAPLAIVRLARLQQICSGFVTAEEYVDDEPVLEDGGIMTEDEYQTSFDLIQSQIEHIRPIETVRKIVDLVEPAKNPRLRLLSDLIDACNHKVIVWCRFRRSVQIICDLLGDRAVRYDGSTSPKDRESALTRFRDAGDPARVFVANVHAISMGVTLNIAKTAIYYENTFSLEKRLQSEDRFHRIGQDQPVQIIDLAAEDTVDQKVIEALRSKYDVAAMVTGDRLREWVQP